MVGEKFARFDYPTSNPIQNLDMIFLVTLALLLLPFLLKLLDLICAWSTRAILRLRRFKTTVVYWNLYIRFLLEAYLELSIVSLLRLRQFRIETVVESALSAFAIVILFILSLAMAASPVFLIHNS